MYFAIDLGLNSWIGFGSWASFQIANSMLCIFLVCKYSEFDKVQYPFFPDSLDVSFCFVALLINMWCSACGHAKLITQVLHSYNDWF